MRNDPLIYRLFLQNVYNKCILFTTQTASLAILQSILTLEQPLYSKYWPRTSNFNFLQPIPNILHGES